MSRDSRPSWRLLLDCARKLTAAGHSPFTRMQLIECVRQIDSSRERGSLDPTIQGMTDNSRGGPPSACGHVFHRVARGQFTLIGEDAQGVGAERNLVATAPPASLASFPPSAAHHAGKKLASSLILVPCSDRKHPGGDPTWRLELTALALLGSEGDRLRDARRSLGRLLDLTPGPDLGEEAARLAYLPALERYDGLLYRGAEFDTWSQEDLETLRHSCLIVSGLYGVVTPDEPIRNYDVGMKTRLPNRQLVKRWWRDRELGTLLRTYVAESSVTDIYCFLSNDYIEAIDGLDFGEVTVHHIACQQGSGTMREQGRAVPPCQDDVRRS